MVVASIILPSLRPERLEECLSNIDENTKGIDYEVIVIAPFDIKPHPNVVYVREEEPGGTVKAVALGCQYAQGEYLINISDDCRVKPGWLANMIAFMRPHDNDIFEGGFKHVAEDGHVVRLTLAGGQSFASLPCLRRDKAELIGGFFDYPYYQNGFGDPDLSFRVRRAGGMVEICDSASIMVLENAPGDKVGKENMEKYFKRDSTAFAERWGGLY